MSRVLIGKDYEGVACVKVTKDAYDPVTTLDSVVGAFLYNSKTAADMKITAVLDPAVIFADATAPGAKYYPAGSVNSNAEAATYVQNGIPAVNGVVRQVFTGEKFYNLPFFDVKTFDSNLGMFVQAKYRRSTYGTQNRGIEYLMSSGGEWYSDFNSTSQTWWTGTKDDTITLSWAKGGSYGYERQIAVVWRLPGINTPILNGTPASPVAGQYSVQIQSDFCRVAKPGYDVRTATKTQLAFDSSSNPAKVLAADDIAVPVGASEYDIGFTLPAGVLADVHFYSGSTIYYPINPVSNMSAAIIGANYQFSGTKLKFQNSGVACRARFIVYAYDNTPPTTGGANSVLRQFTAGGQDVVQFVRPGAAASPAFADIVLDTRWPSLRMIAEGYIAVGTGENTYEVNFTSSGMLPMVRFVTVHGAKTSGTVKYSASVRVPRVRVLYIDPQVNPVAGWIGGDTTYCTLTSTKASFKTFKGNPTRVFYSSVANAEDDVRSFLYDESPLVGIRYYIFGIPN